MKYHRALFCLCLWTDFTGLSTLLRLVMLSSLLGFPWRADAAISLNDVLVTSLNESPSLAIKKASENIFRSSFFEARSVFDPQVVFSTGYNGKVPVSQTEHQNVYQSSLSITALTLFGVSISPNISIVGIADNTMPSTTNQGTTALTIGIPLGEGLGRNMSWANMTYASKNYEAAGYDLEFAASQIVHDAAAAYWNYVFSYQALQFAMGRRKSAEEQLGIATALANAGEISHMKLEQSKAFLYGQEQSVVMAYLGVVSDWHALLAVMGRKVNGRETPEVPQDKYPLPLSSSALAGLDASALTGLALEKSADFRSKKVRVEATDALMAGSRNGKRQKFDLKITGAYTGWQDGATARDYFESVSGKNKGMNVSATLTYTLPLGDHGSEAVLIRSRALYEQSRVEREELVRDTNSALFEDVEWIKALADAYGIADASVESYRLSKAGELRKFRMGLSDLTALQTATDRLADAENEFNGLGRKYALRLLDIRLKTGTLITNSGAGFSIDREALFTLPGVPR